MNIVWIVERRENNIPTNVWENTVYGVFSTKIKAIEFCKKEAVDEKEKLNYHPWWFYISENVLDMDMLDTYNALGRDCESIIISWNGELIDYQPYGGYQSNLENQRRRNERYFN